MKRAVKISLAAAGILTVLGLASLGIGLMLGGGGHIPRGMGAFPILRLFTHGDTPASPAAGSAYGSEEQDFHEVKNLILDFSCCDLKILEHEEDYISLSASNTQDTFTMEQHGQDLILEDHRTFLGDDADAYPDMALQLTLLLPTDGLDTLDISLDLGDVEAETLSAGTVTVFCSLGSMKAERVLAEDAEFRFDLGDLELERLQVTGSASIDASCGDIDLKSYKGPELNLTCDLGNASVTAEGREQDYNYELVCDLGKARLNGQHHNGHHGSGHDLVGCHITQDNQAACSIYAACSMGGLDLNFSEED